MSQRLAGSSATERAPGSHRAALVFTVLLVLALRWYVPFGPLVLYPFTLLATWVHEMGHGLTALLLGGSFQRLLIFPDASGLAEHTAVPGLSQVATAAGGLLAPPFLGMILLAGARRLSRPLILLLAVGIFASLGLWVRTGVGWVTLTPLGLVLLVLGRYASAELCQFAVRLLGVLLAADTINGLGYFFVAAGQVGGRLHPSDIAAVAKGLGGPLQLWGGLLAGVSLLFLLLGLCANWVGGRRGLRARP